MYMNLAQICYYKIVMVVKLSFGLYNVMHACMHAYAALLYSYICNLMHAYATLLNSRKCSLNVCISNFTECILMQLF